MRLKNVTLGYSLPASLLAKTKILSKARVYVTGSDLWEHSKINDGWDPEANRKVDNSKRYPFLRTVTFGLNLDLIKNFEYEISDIENYSFLLKKLNFLFLGFTCKSFIILSFCLNKLAISSLVKISKSKLI